MDQDKVLETNRAYWNARADEWFGTTALPEVGVFCPSEEELKLFGDVKGQRMLEICCGSGHSLLYNAKRGAAELWGVDISESQLNNARRLLDENGVTARLICSPMESMDGIPDSYFDCVYSIYGMGWATDLAGVFRKVYASLRPGGRFIFSWGHPLYYCVAYYTGTQWNQHEELQKKYGLTMARSYFDEENFTLPLEGGDVIFPNRRISTWVNALAEAGFRVERIVEETNCVGEPSDEDTFKQKKARMLPCSVCFVASKQAGTIPESGVGF